MTGPLLAAGREADVYALDERQLDTLTPGEIALIDTAAERVRACAP